MYGCHDCDHGRRRLAFHVFVATCDPPGRSPLVDCRLFSPPSRLQPLVTPLAIVTLILVV